MKRFSMTDLPTLLFKTNIKVKQKITILLKNYVKYWKRRNTVCYADFVVALCALMSFYAGKNVLQCWDPNRKCKHLFTLENA